MIAISYGRNRLVVDQNNGAAIAGLEFERQGKIVNLIKLERQPAHKSSLLFPFPNRLKDGQFEFEGQQYSFEHNDYGRPNALHGFISDKHFQLKAQTNQSLSFIYSYEGNDPSYPFPFKLEVAYTLYELELNIELEITNTGGGDMPCGFGWHPYFSADLSPDSTRLKLPNLSKIHVDERLIPNGEESPMKGYEEFRSIAGEEFDNCFRLERIQERNSVFLNYPKLATVEIWQGHNFPFLQLFKVDDQAIAIEPMSCGIDALNSKEGLKVLSPQQEWALTMGLKIY